MADDQKNGTTSAGNGDNAPAPGNQTRKKRKGHSKPGSSTESADLISRLLDTIPNLTNLIHLVAFLAVIALLVMRLLAGLNGASLIFMLAGVAILVLFVHAPAFLHKDHPGVAIVFMVVVVVCFLATIGLGIFFALRSGDQITEKATWDNAAAKPLEDLIIPVMTHEGYNFLYAEIPAKPSADKDIKALRLRTYGTIRKATFADVFAEIARLNRPCLRSEWSVSDQLITLTLDTTAGTFVLEEGYDNCHVNERGG